MGGFKKLFSDSPFGFFNQDLHDALLTCLTFYDEYSYRYQFPGGYTGETAYPYQTPATSGPIITNFGGVVGPYCGYAEDFYSVYHHDALIHTDVPTITEARTGYPYSIAFYDAICPAPGNDSYGGSLFYLMSWYTTQTTSPGYGYGTPVPLTHSPYDYTTVYCGPYEHLRDACREPITLLAEAELEDTGRKLIAATKSRIYALSESSANWVVLADGLGGQYAYDTDCATCSNRRFTTARLGGYHLFTNNFDPVLAWRFEAPITGCAEWRAQYHDELLTIGVTKVGVLGSWNGFAFFADVEQDGQSFPSRIFWSDFNAPLSVIPGGTSQAGSSDLGFGEQILRFEPLGGQARLYTDKAIYEVLLVGGDEVFRFLAIYRGDDSLKYKHSLVNVGNAHIYLGETGIFTLEEYGRKPVRVEWQHKASGAIYDGVSATDLAHFPDLPAFGPINKAQCDQAIGWFDTERKLIWFSWPSDSHECPNVSLVMSLQYGFSSLVNKGFTAGVSYTSDPRQSLMDWLRLNQVCNFSDFITDIKKMGIPYNSSDDLFSDPPDYFWNAEENWDLPQGPNSLCGRLGATSIEDICGEDCRTRTLMIVADAEDYTLKEYDPDIFYRERFVDDGLVYSCPYTSVGRYVLEGYTSMVQGDTHKYGKSGAKTINKAQIDFVARQQATPSLLEFEVGFASQPSCVTWKPATPVELRCLTEQTLAEHEAANTRADTLAKFPTFRTGVFIAYRAIIRGIGGGACFSSVVLSVRLKQSCW